MAISKDLLDLAREALVAHDRIEHWGTTNAPANIARSSLRNVLEVLIDAADDPVPTLVVISRGDTLTDESKVEVIDLDNIRDNAEQMSYASIMSVVDKLRSQNWDDLADELEEQVANTKVESMLPRELGLYQNDNGSPIEHAVTYRHTEFGWANAINNTPLTEGELRDLAALNADGRLVALLRKGQ